MICDYNFTLYRIYLDNFRGNSATYFQIFSFPSILNLRLGWQLPIAKEINFPSETNFLSISLTNFSNNTPPMQLICWLLWRQGKDCTFLKQRGFLALQITNIGNLFLTMFATTALVMRILPNFVNVLFGRHS